MMCVFCRFLFIGTWQNSECGTFQFRCFVRLSPIILPSGHRSRSYMIELQIPLSTGRNVAVEIDPQHHSNNKLLRVTVLHIYIE